MKRAAFKELFSSINEARKIRVGTRKPSRVMKVERDYVIALRRLRDSSRIISSADMRKILADKPLKKKLRAGLRDAKRRKGRLIS